MKEEMADIPNKIVSAKLQDIEDAYSGVTAALNSNLAASTATINAYNRLAGRLGAPNALGGILTGSGYQATNALLERQT